MKVDTWEYVTRLRKWLDTEAASTSVQDARLLRVLKISEELGEVAEALHGALGANPRQGASHGWGDVVKELADVIVTAAVALDTVSGDGAAVVEQQLQGRMANESAAAGDIRLPHVLAMSEDMGQIATAVYGALSTRPRGKAIGLAHTWEEVETRLGRLISRAAAALDNLTGDAWETAAASTRTSLRRNTAQRRRRRAHVQQPLSRNSCWYRPRVRPDLARRRPVRHERDWGHTTGKGRPLALQTDRRTRPAAHHSCGCGYPPSANGCLLSPL
ncbi:MazG-like family protein [Streptomyces lavendulocolor]|uniref:MazG-like family protein n=1 Tax=Streptomyces lavendulocolor TaxID=67316 RepID=UPI003C2EB645